MPPEPADKMSAPHFQTHFKVRRQPQFPGNSRHGKAVVTVRQDIRVKDSKHPHPLPSVATETAEPLALRFVLKATALPPSRTDEKDS